jgi:hypothetical protein
MDIWYGLSFKRKLQSGILALTLGLTGASLFAVHFAAEDVARKKIERDFDRSIEMVQELIRIRTSSLQESIATALSDPVFRSHVGRSRSAYEDTGLGQGRRAGGETARELRASHQIFASAGLPAFNAYPVLMVLNSDGYLLYSRKAPEAYGKKVALTQNLREQGHFADLGWSAEK